MQKFARRSVKPINEISDVKRGLCTDTLAPAVCVFVCVRQGVLEGLQAAEVMEEKLKAQLNELCGFSGDLGPQSDRVSALIKLHNR